MMLRRDRRHWTPYSTRRTPHSRRSAHRSGSRSTSASSTSRSSTVCSNTRWSSDVNSYRRRSCLVKPSRAISIRSPTGLVVRRRSSRPGLKCRSIPRKSPANSRVKRYVINVCIMLNTVSYSLLGLWYPPYDTMVFTLPHLHNLHHTKSFISDKYNYMLFCGVIKTLCVI